MAPCHDPPDEIPLTDLYAGADNSPFDRFACGAAAEELAPPLRKFRTLRDQIAKLLELFTSSHEDRPYEAIVAHDARLVVPIGSIEEDNLLVPLLPRRTHR
jgi:hypothetical protein